MPSVSHHILCGCGDNVELVGGPPPKKVTRDQLLWLILLCSRRLHTTSSTTPIYNNPTLEIWKLFSSSLAFATVFLLNLGFFRCKTTRKRPFDPIWHRIKPSQGSWKADLSITLGILFVLVLLFKACRNKEGKPKWLYSECYFPCMQTAKQMLHFSWGNQSFFLVLLFPTVVWHFQQSCCSCFNKQFNMIFYLLCKSQILPCKNRKTLFPPLLCWKSWICIIWPTFAADSPV